MQDGCSADGCSADVGCVTDFLAFYVCYQAAVCFIDDQINLLLI